LREATAQPTIEEIIDQCGRRLGSPPAILDWNSGLQLAQSLPRHAVFSPPSSDFLLPYLEHSVDLVVLRHDQASLSEARRVASAAVVTVSSIQDATNPVPQFSVEWQSDGTTDLSTAVSLICLAD